MAPDTYYDGRTPAIVALDVKRMNALARQDADAYYQACVALGVEPEDNQLFQRGLEGVVDEGKLRRSLKKIGDKRVIRPDMVAKYLSVYRQGRGLDPLNPQGHIEEKRAILNSLYPSLTGQGGEKVLTFSAKDSRVGNMFKDYYQKGEKISKQSKQ